MDIRTLPENERDIYNRLRSSYSLHFESLKIDKDTIRLLKVSNIEELLGDKDPFANVGDFPFWVKLWEAAQALAEVLHRLPPGNGKRLLELGAGLGAPGIGAALNGYDVTITDYEEVILDFQRVSVAASGLAGKVRIDNLDWLNPPEMVPYDILCGAEVLFREEFFQPLLNIFRASLAPDGMIILAHDARRQSLPKFLELAREYFVIDGMVRKMRKDQKEITIILNRLRPLS